MKAGNLRFRAILEQATETRDSVGAVVQTWAAVATVWADIEPLYGRELIAAQQVTSDMTARIRMRWRAGVTPKMRIKQGARIFDILSVINLGQLNRELELMVKERNV